MKGGVWFTVFYAGEERHSEHFSVSTVLLNQPTPMNCLLLSNNRVETKEILSLVNCCIVLDAFERLNSQPAASLSLKVQSSGSVYIFLDR